MIRTMIALAALLAISGTALAQTTTWTGSTSNVWNDPSNWDSGVPDGATSAVIPGAAGAYPSLYTTSPTCNDLTIDSGASLVLSSGWDLSVNAGLSVGGTLTVTSTTSNISVTGNWVNTGTFTHGGSTVTLNGSASVGGSSSTAFQNLTIGSGTRTLAAAISVDGDLEIASGASVDVGSFTHVVAGNWTSSGVASTISGTGIIEFTGDGQLTTLSNSLPNVLVSAGTRSVNTSAIAGNLDLTGGILQILDFSTLSVGGDANCTGGTLSFAGLFAGPDVLEVSGALTLASTAGTMNADSTIRVTGDWSSSNAWSPSAGVVEMDGAGIGSLGGASPTFADLHIVSGTRSAGAVIVTGTLTVEAGASLESTAPMDVSGDVSMGATGSWILGAFTHTVTGDWVSAGGSASGAGAIDFNGDGQLLTGSATISNVTVSAGTRTANTSVVSGDLALTGGTLLIGDDQTLSVSGDAHLTSGTLSWPGTAAGFLDALIVTGNATVTAAFGTGSSSARFRVGGDWNSTSAFSPTVGVVSLDTATVATVSGASPVFFDLAIVSSTKTFTSNTTVGGSLTVANGATLDTSAALDVAGNVTLGDGTSSWNMGTSTHAIAGNFASAGGSASGVGGISFDGIGSVSTGGGSISNVDIVAGTRTAATTAITGNLGLSGSGALVIGNDAVVSVAGNADLSAGTLSWFPTTAGGFDTLDVEGDVTIAAAFGGGSLQSRLRCAGNWSSTGAYLPTTGTVSLDSGTSVSIAGAAPNFYDLVVLDGTKTATSTVTVANNLIVASGQTMALSGADVSVAGDVTVLGTVDLGGNTLAAAGTWTSGAATATVSGPGTVEWTGNGTSTGGSNVLPDVLISGGVRTTSGVAVGGSLDLTTSAALRIADNTSLTVAGDVTFASGTNFGFIDTSGGLEVLDVEGALVCSASSGPTSINTLISAAGDWTSDANWVPGSGRVRFDGGTVATVSATNLPTAVVLSGTKTFTSPSIVTGDLSVANGAQLDSTAALSVTGDVILGDGTSGWDLGASTHTVAGNWTSVGGLATGAGTVEFTGAGSLATGGGSIPNVSISAGLRTAGTSTITGDLSLSGAGELLIDDDTVLTVVGNANLTGGTLGWAPSAVGGLDELDVQGDATVSATYGSGSSLSRFRVAGNWSSTSAFAPSAGTVILDGGSPATVGGTDPTFFDLRIADGDRTLTANATVADNLIIDALQTLTLSAADVSVSGDVTVNGSLDMGGRTATVAGDWTSDAVGASVVGPGTVDLTSDGTLSTGSNTVPDVVVSGGTRTVAGSTVDGTLDVTAGTLRVADNATVVVVGTSTMALGTTLEFDDTTVGVERLDLDGDADIASTAGAMSANTLIQCAGNWVSDAAWVPSAGRVRFDGGTVANVDGPTFPTIVVVDGVKTLTGASMLSGDLNLASGASLVSGAAIDVNGNVALMDATASWDMGIFNHFVAGNWTSTGASATGSGTIEFDGTGTVDTGTGAIGNVLVSDGTRTVLDATVSGNLVMTGLSTLFIDDDSTLTVGSNLDLLGGTLQWFGTAVGGFDLIDVAGDVTLTAAYGGGSSLSRLLVGGNWSSTSAFSPTAGLVTLDSGTVATVGGTAPAFFDLAISAGDKTLVADATVAGDFTVIAGQSMTLAAADIDVSGDVIVTGTFDLGGRTATVAGNWTSSAGGAAVAGPGTLAFTGAGTLSTGVNTVPDVQVTSGLRAVTTSSIDGNLDVTGGTLALQDNSTVSVSGNATFTGSTLTYVDTTGGFETLDVAGDVFLSAVSGGTSSSSVFDCAGNWTSDATWAPASGRVRFDGGATTIDADNLRTITILTGTKTFVTGTVIGGNLFISSGAVLDADAALDVAGGVFLGDGTSSWDVGSFTHTVAGNWLSSGGSAVGLGGIRFDASGVLDTSGGAISNVTISAGLRTAQTSSIVGDLGLIGAGSLLIDDDATLSVGGDANLTSGVVGWFATATGLTEVLDVAGNATVTSSFGNGSTLSRFRVGGNWSSTSAFTPTVGVVQLDQGSAATIGGADPVFFDLLVSDGAKTLVSSAVLGGSLLVSAGQSLTLSGADIDVAGDATVNGTLGMGGGTATVVGDWLSDAVGATVDGPGTIDLTGTGTLSTGANTVPDLVVSSGTRTLSDAVITGSLTVDAGTLRLQDNGTLTVGGDAVFATGSVLSFIDTTAGLETVDVQGDVSMAATSGATSANTLLTCAGNWSSNGDWAPAAGTVRLDGVGPTSLTGLAPDQTLSVPALVIENGVRQLTTDMTLDVDSILVDATAALDLQGNQAVVPGAGGPTAVTVDGTVSIGAGGNLALGDPVTMSVGSTGTLAMAGTFGNDASVTGDGAGSYTLTVQGTLDASDYVFGGMDANGIIVSPTATILDMDPGRFENPSPAPGSTLLNISRLSPAQYDYVDFVGSGSGTYNVSTLFGSSIEFVNSAGDFAGEAFDNDPSNLVDWTTDATILVDFSGTPLGADVALSWETSLEVNVTSFTVQRATSPGGPFTDVDTQAAVGPGVYGTVDTGLSNDVYTYRLVQLLTSSATVVLDTITVVVTGAGGGPPVYISGLDARVGGASGGRAKRRASPGAPVTPLLPGNGLGSVLMATSAVDLAAALDDLAGVRNPVIRVTPGTYAAFAPDPVWEGTLRILASGKGPVLIDTSDGPIHVAGLDSSQSIELSDLVVGSVESDHPALVVEDCAGLVIVDESSLTGGAGQPALEIVASSRVAVQRTAVTGPSAVMAGSSVTVGGGSIGLLHVTGGSLVRTSGVTALPVVEPGSRHVEFGAGGHADVELPEFVVVGKSFQVTLRGAPGGRFALTSSPELSWTDGWVAGDTRQEMVAMLNEALGRPVLVQTFGATGRLQFTVTLPEEDGLIRLPIAVQLAVEDPTTGALRWSNVAAFVPVEPAPELGLGDDRGGNGGDGGNGVDAIDTGDGRDDTPAAGAGPAPLR